MTQSDTIELIPLNRLLTSSLNVRRKDRKADIDALAASIASHGLLQNLAVAACGDQKYEVVAGGRRLAALKSLAKTGAIARDYPVPCKLVEAREGREASLAENVHRLNMDAMDEVDAYSQLVAEGSSPDEVARRFGVTRRHVDQRLALSGLSAKIRAAWKRGDVSLDAARAFCLVDDHERQNAVFKMMGKPVTHAASVRARLMEGRMRACDRLVLFVGLDTYEAAGGAVVRDLFDEAAVFIEDPGLVAKLAEEKLEALRSPYLADGWKWAEIDLGLGSGANRPADGRSRIYPSQRDYTAEEQAEVDRLESELEALEAAIERDEIEDDPRWDTHDDLSGAIEALRQSARQWDVKLIAHAGVALSVGHDGGLSATEGLVLKADRANLEAVRRKPSITNGNEEPNCGTGGEDAVVDDDHHGVVEGDRCSGLPKSLARELTAARSRALRVALGEAPDIALALAVAAMAVRARQHSDLSGVEIDARPLPFEDDERLEARRGALDEELPVGEEVLDWCLAQDRASLLSILALLVAGAVDLTHEDTSPTHRRRQLLADRLAQALDIDMTQYWTADLDYWIRLSKGRLLEALALAPGLEAMSEGARESLLKAHGKLRKDELAARVAKAFGGSGYLPDLLVTPVRAGVLELTPAGETEAA